MRTALHGFGRIAASAVLMCLVAAAPAGAHGGNAVFDVETDVSGRDVSLEVAITYETDGEPAEGALVEAFGVGPVEERTAPLTLQRVADGRYRGATTVPVPGTWRFTIASSFPPGSTEVTVDVDEPGGGGSRLLTWWILVVAAGAFAAAAIAFSAGRLRRRRRTTGRPDGS